MLKDRENNKVAMSEVVMICIILGTAEYCLETTQQLEAKIQEKTQEPYRGKVLL